MQPANEELERLWKALDASDDASSAARYTARLCKAVSSCDLFLARENASGLDAMVVEGCDCSAVDDSLPDRTFGFNVKVEAGLGDRRTSLVLGLGNKHYQEVFRYLVADIVVHLAALPDSEGVAQTVVDRTSRWREFMRVRNPGGLSEDQRVGLAGELLVLRECLAPVLGWPRTVAGWVGPLKAAHDWECAEGALEIKTTRAQIVSTIHISSADQLDPGELPVLHLVLVHLKSQHGSGESLPGIVDSIRSVLSAPESVRFNDLLLQAEYFDPDARLYVHPTFSVRGYRTYEVDETFPRFTIADLPEGVVSLKYAIAAQAIESRLRESEGVYRALGGQR